MDRVGEQALAEREECCDRLLTSAIGAGLGGNCSYALWLQAA